MPPFDINGSLRRLKPEKHTSPLIGRSDADLSFIDGEAIAGSALLLDSTVYIHVLTGKTPAKVDQLLQVRTINHSSVVVGELTNRLGARIPRDEREARARGKLLAATNGIPAHRLITPTAMNWGEAGILSGIVARLGGYPAGRTQDDLNDALIFLQARANGLAILTANVADFDRLQQLLPDVRVPVLPAESLMTSTDRVRRVNERGGSETEDNSGKPIASDIDRLARPRGDGSLFQGEGFVSST